MQKHELTKVVQSHLEKCENLGQLLTPSVLAAAIMDIPDIEGLCLKILGTKAYESEARIRWIKNQNRQQLQQIAWHPSNLLRNRVTSKFNLDWRLIEIMDRQAEQLQGRYYGTMVDKKNGEVLHRDFWPSSDMRCWMQALMRIESLYGVKGEFQVLQAEEPNMYACIVTLDEQTWMDIDELVPRGLTQALIGACLMKGLGEKP